MHRFLLARKKKKASKSDDILSVMYNDKFEDLSCFKDQSPCCGGGGSEISKELLKGLIKTTVGKIIEIETKQGDVIHGTVVSIDVYMNLHMTKYNRLNFREKGEEGRTKPFSADILIIYDNIINLLYPSFFSLIEPTVRRAEIEAVLDMPDGKISDLSGYDVGSYNDSSSSTTTATTTTTTTTTDHEHNHHYKKGEKCTIKVLKELIGKQVQVNVKKGQEYQGKLLHSDTSMLKLQLRNDRHAGMGNIMLIPTYDNLSYMRSDNDVVSNILLSDHSACSNKTIEEVSTTEVPTITETMNVLSTKAFDSSKYDSDKKGHSIKFLTKLTDKYIEVMLQNGHKFQGYLLCSDASMLTLHLPQTDVHFRKGSGYADLGSTMLIPIYDNVIYVRPYELMP